MNELKKCPFCGCEVRFVKTGCSSRGKIGHLYCDGCKETFFKNDKWHTESELCEIWNTRKPEEEVVAMLEGLKSLFDENNYQLRYERFCKPKKDVCVGRNCFACVIDEVIEKVKEEVG